MISTLPSLKPSNAESGAAEATDRPSSGSTQPVQPTAQPQVSRPSLPLGSAEGFGIGQHSRHPPAPQQPSSFGFSKYQLTLLRNQILAFKKLRARKVCIINILVMSDLRKPNVRFVIITIGN